LGAAILDALPIGLYVVDRELKVVAWNRGRKLGTLGKPRHRALGKPLSKVLPARGFENVKPILARIFETAPRVLPGQQLYKCQLPVRQGAP
jgi:PAS domain-containing protein